MDQTIPPSNGTPESDPPEFEPEIIPAPEDDIKEIPPHRFRPRLVPRPGKPSPRVVIHGRKRYVVSDLYAHLMQATWPTLVVTFISTFLVINTVFAIAYFGLADLWPGEGIARARHGYFLDYFFFSVQTLATIGYGGMSPEGIIANVLVTLEAVTGFTFYALMTGLVFSKFSRPTARVTFSERAVINNDMGDRHLILRMINDRGNRIVDAEAALFMMRDDFLPDGSIMRRYYDLPLARSKVPIMQLSWSVMHRIDESSPLFGETAESLYEKNAEVIVAMSGLDESLSSTIHTRFSYMSEEIHFDRSFKGILHRQADNTLEVHYDKIHDLKD
jgi:inward rectifier potassium channel